MRAGVARVFCILAATGFALLATKSARAIPFQLQVYADGALIGDVNQSRLGCVDNPDGVSAHCYAQNLDYGSAYPLVEVDIGNPNDPNDPLVISDPVVSGPVGITNLQPTTQHFTFVFTLPVSPMATTITGGRVSGTLTDHDSNGATVSAPTGSSLYLAMLDGLPWQPLYSDPTSFSVLNGSTSIPNVTFGSPIPSMPGPAVNTSIGIRLDFNLTGFDSVSFTSNHVVVVPEPGTAALLGLGLAFLARRRRSD